MTFSSPSVSRLQTSGRVRRRSQDARRLQKGDGVTGLQRLPGYKLGMNSNQAAHLVLDYRPSRPTGWASPEPGKLGKTIGGHHPVKEFKLADRRYQIGLLAFGQPDGSPNPVYERVPGDSTIAFRRTLERKFGAHYSFRYRGGLGGQNEFRVQCYSVFANPQQIGFGAELYVVYQPDVHAGDPPAQAQLGWIQVVHWSGTGAPSPARYVDGRGRSNPVFLTGGLTSIFGTRVFNFDNLVAAQPSQGQGGNRGLSARYLAETFLARDTLTKNAAGKDVIDVFGGIKYGWQLQEVTR
jgi:hypothetical protein